MEESITRQDAMGEGGRMRMGSSTLQSIMPAKAITFIKSLTAQSFLGLQILSYAHILRYSFVLNKFHGTTFVKENDIYSKGAVVGNCMRKAGFVGRCVTTFQSLLERVEFKENFVPDIKFLFNP